VGTLIEGATPPGMRFSSVPDNEERAYFLKTQAQRKQRQFTGDKRKNIRGQDKVGVAFGHMTCGYTFYIVTVDQ